MNWGAVMNKATLERFNEINKLIEWIKRNLNDVEEYAFNPLSAVNTNDYFFKRRIPLNQEIGFDGSEISLYNFIQYLIEACGARGPVIRMYGCWKYKEDLEKLFDLSKVMKSSFRGKYAVLKVVDGKIMYDAYKLDMPYSEDVMKAYKYDEVKHGDFFIEKLIDITCLDNLEEGKLYSIDYNLLRVLIKGVKYDKTN